MFTGIVEEIARVKAISQLGNTLKVSIIAKLIMEDIKLGDSIAVNGVCLTVCKFNHESFCVDVMPATFYATNLARLKANSLVNLERAMAANGRFGGHMVSGHIDATGKIAKITPVANALIYTLQFTADLIAFCLPKGSIAIDGTSLTIIDVWQDKITVSLIPHTRKHSILGFKKQGDLVNIECDMMAKQQHKMDMGVKKQTLPGITTDFLSKHGFI